MAGDRGHNDNDNTCHSIIQLDELKRIEKRHQPRDHHQPGAVASPFHGFHGVEQNTVYPGQCRIYQTCERSYEGYDRYCELRNICQEKLEIISFNIGHKIETKISHAKKAF